MTVTQAGASLKSKLITFGTGATLSAATAIVGFTANNYLGLVSGNNAALFVPAISAALGLATSWLAKRRATTTGVAF